VFVVSISLAEWCTTSAMHPADREDEAARDQAERNHYDAVHAKAIHERSRERPEQPSRGPEISDVVQPNFFFERHD
jgi:hypothetical protein